MPLRRRAPAPTLALAALLAAGSPVAHAVPAEDALQRLAAAVAGESELARGDFAAIALGEVVLAYELELDRLSAPGQVSRREQAKQWRWAGALRRYLETLHAAQQALDAGEPVEVLVAPPAPVQLLIGEHQVPLSSPRIENPLALDNAIVRVYCEAFACDPDLLEAPEPTSFHAVAGGWSFRDGWGSTYETGDGLGFMFRDVRDRGAKERVVRQIHEELRRLVAVVAGARRAGRAVDYRTLRVEEAGRGEDHRVILASGMPGTRVWLPALARAPGVVEIARDWIRARVEGRPARQLFPRADLLLADVLPGARAAE